MNVAVIFGGCSSEYGVSLESAGSVLSHIDRNSYAPVMIGITPEGKWYHFTGELSKIPADTWLNDEDCAPAAFCLDRYSPSLMVFHKNKVEKIELHAVFPVLHGKNGEDGTVQGLCELAGIPLVGCGTLASALCMDKDRAHKLVYLEDIAVPHSFVLKRDMDKELALERAEKFCYPLFVKPVKSGSSYGVTRVPAREDFVNAVMDAFRYDDEVIVEEAVPGFEVGCAVMGNEELITGEIDEIELKDGFFDFTEKYNLVTSAIHVPARIPVEKSDELKNTAKTIYKALGCRGFARVDMFLTPDGQIVFNEVNTIPGFTAHSRFPSMMKEAGMTFEQVISHAIELAVKK